MDRDVGRPLPRAGGGGGGALIFEGIRTQCKTTAPAFQDYVVWSLVFSLTIIDIALGISLSSYTNIY